jgi:CRP-like cAMP-binding protein
MPKYVYFILKGEVFVSNESGTFHYLKLGAGSYIGDINITLDYPSSYSVL